MKATTNKKGHVIANYVERVPWAFASHDALAVHASNAVRTAHAACIEAIDAAKLDTNPLAPAPRALKVSVKVEVLP